ncbi:kinetochore complex Sim4 subunit Fta1-domain-containing protein [Microdochium bolleyi]|uniref:Kinetochore complex Sim4 subunit Fta1-domain-containing protein n=1 Tax=Microdochium bolleyi TaxID=196109 RepID=A0A136IW95_9PEZI|nr:kinetochore complex Sim4 subunit Fta1-domain-containing protein [Microdochium bolleyi]
MKNAPSSLQSTATAWAGLTSNGRNGPADPQPLPEVNPTFPGFPQDASARSAKCETGHNCSQQRSGSSSSSSKQKPITTRAGRRPASHARATRKGAIGASPDPAQPFSHQDTHNCPATRRDHHAKYHFEEPVATPGLPTRRRHPTTHCMPPRKRKAPAAVQDDREREASPRPSDDSAQEDDFGPDGQPRGSMPFFNVTYTTHRASPLHIGSEPLSPARLQTLSRRLRDTLVGDVVRGVQVGLASGGDDGSLGRTGVLESVEWRWVRWNDLLGITDDDDEGLDSREGSQDLGTADHDTSSRRRTSNGRRALCLELKYENAYFTASLLPTLDPGGPPKVLPWDPTSNTTEDAPMLSRNFLHLPLLLLRMPASLRSVVCDFLASNFDCRISPLHLGTRSLVHMWESWLTSNRTSKGGAKVTKDVVLTLGFHLEHLDNPPTPAEQPPKDSDTMQVDDEDKDPSPPQPVPHGLRSIDVIIPAPHVARFVRAGRNIEASSIDAQQQPASIIGKRKRGAKPAPSVFSSGPLEPGWHPERLDSLARLRRKLAGNKSEEGWNWRSTSQQTNTDDDNENTSATTRSTTTNPQQQPFTEAVAAYLSSHLALDLFHPAVRITKVACGGFVAAESGRLKIFTPLSTASSLPLRAAQRLVADLAGKAASGGVLATTTRTTAGRTEQGGGQAAEPGGGGGPWSEAAVRLAELAAAATKKRSPARGSANVEI